MKKYARINNGMVAELFETDTDIKKLFHPSLIWVDITDLPHKPSEGWQFKEGLFSEAPALNDIMK
ncbi:hypothetical protein [Ewingella americana]